MEYKKLTVTQDFCVTHIISIHYFEYPCDYQFVGESHDFWEFLYVDKGQVIVTFGEKTETLTKGSIIFHKPGEFHAVCCDNIHAPNLIVVAFDCCSPLMEKFNTLICTAGEQERIIFATIIKEAQSAFISPLDNPELKELTRALNPKIGCEQLIKNSLESLLIGLARRLELFEQPEKLISVISTQNKKQLICNINNYLEENISQQLTLQQISSDNLISNSYLQKLFRERTGGGAMEYFGKLKITRAKHLIREGRHNFTEIAEELGYSSLHYFSRHFKKVSGMTPSEYASSVKLLSHTPSTSLFDY